MKITGARDLDLCCAALAAAFQSRAVLSAETDSFFRAHMAAASKCMHHCGWINKYPLKEPGSEE